MASDCTNAQVHRLFSVSSLCNVNGALLARLVAQQHARYQVVAPLMNVSDTNPLALMLRVRLVPCEQVTVFQPFHILRAPKTKKTTECEKRARWRVRRSEGLRRWRGRKCDSGRTCTRAKSSFRSTRLHFTVSHEMILHSFRNHVACDGTVSHCMNFNMRRSDVIPFTGFAFRKTHATWLCDHF